MANTAYQNNIRTATLGGFNFGFDARTEWDNITRVDNTISITNLRTRMRVNSGSPGSWFSGYNVDVHTDVPSGTRRRNASLGSGRFDRGQDYLGSAGNYSLTVGAAAVVVTSRSGVTVDGGTGWTNAQNITIPALGLPSLSSQSVSNIGVRSATIAAVVAAGTNSSGIQNVQLQYGLTTSYGTNVNDTSSPYSWNLANLLPGTTYHYRFVITNNGGRVTTTGDFTFTTLPAPSVSDTLLKILGIM